MGIIDYLASNNYIVVNKEIAKLLGIEGAVLLGELCSEYSYWKSTNELEDGYFYSTIENIEKQTTLLVKKQRELLNKMKNMNLVDVIVKGMPAKRYIKVNEDEIIKLLTNKLGQNDQTRWAEMAKQDRSKWPTNNNNIISNKNNNNLKEYMSLTSKDIYKKEFDELWKLYPNKKGKTKAQSKYETLRKQNKVTYDEVYKGIQDYVFYLKENHIEPRYIKNGSTWFNQECWNDDYSVIRKEQSDNIILDMLKEGAFNED